MIRALVRQNTRADRSPPVSRETRRLREPAMCERCGAVYQHKTWRKEERTVAFTPPIGVHWTVCPACRQVREGEYYGQVLARGAFVLPHEREIRARIHNVSSRAEFTQPERRLISVELRRGEMEVLTTSQKLAHRIAHELEKAFGGTTSYHWSDEDGTLTATWVCENGRLGAAEAPRRRR